MERSLLATGSPFGALESQVDKLLKQHNCFDLKQPLLDSLFDIAQSDLELEEKAVQWQQQWIAKYGNRLPVDLVHASELCDLASDIEGSRKIGEDIRAMLPIPSGHFCENGNDTMAPVPLPATNTSGYPPTATCDPISDEEGDDIDDAQSDSDADSNPINVSVP